MGVGCWGGKTVDGEERALLPRGSGISGFSGGMNECGFFTFEPSAISGIVPFELSEEFGEEEIILAVGDEFVDHVVETLALPKAVDDGPEGRAVVAEAAEVFGGEGGEEELADGGDVIVVCTVAHGSAPV